MLEFSKPRNPIRLYIKNNPSNWKNYDLEEEMIKKKKEFNEIESYSKLSKAY